MIFFLILKKVYKLIFNFKIVCGTASVSP